MAAIDDYVVTPGGVVDVGGNPVTYDASGNINPTYTTDMSSSLSGLTSLLTPFKGIFDRLKSGQTTANDVNAALGVLGLLMPALNAPKTAGWKGSIDLSKQFTRTPMVNPASTYTPYSGKPVMGQQYFTSTYGAPPAPAAPPATPVTPPVTTNPDLDNPSSTGGLAMGGVASLRKFASGGSTELQHYDYAAGQNRKTVDVPGVGPVEMFFDLQNKRVVVSDEPFWNPKSPHGEALDKVVDWARQQGLQAGVAITPYSSQAFGGKASDEDLRSLVDATDFVVTDPYIVNQAQASPGNIDMLQKFTSNVGNYAKDQGKDAWMVLQGFNTNDVDPKVVADYNKSLIDANKNNYNQVSFFNKTDFGPTEDTSGVSQIDAPLFASTVQNVQQPALSNIAGALPSGWFEYSPNQKIDWFNQNRVTPEQLSASGVGQESIDWMRGQGYLGSYEPKMPASQTQLQAQQNIASLPSSTMAQPTGIAQLTQQPISNEQPKIPRLGQEEQVEAAQGGLMGFARGGVPRYLRGHTDGMADKIPSDIDGVQPAKLSHGEFVIPADVVSHLGNGNSDAGADVLYKMMDRVRQARTGTKKQGREINPEKFTPGGIAGYAGGGAVAFAAGDLVSDPTKTPLGTSTETNISSWAGPYVGDMLSKTSALTNAPYQAWTGPLSAGYSPLQEKVFSGLGSMQFPGVLGQSFTGSGTPTLPSATDMTGGPATGIAANYMNPYLNAVLQPQLEELRRQSQITQMGTAGKLAQAGAYGGSRQAIMDAEAQRNLLQEQNKAIGTGYASAYDKALQQFNTEQGQAKTLAEMMAGAGQQQRGIEQEGITEARKQFETEQLKPYTDLRFQKEMLSGLPVQTAATTANTSTMGQFAGGFEQLAKALKELGVG